MKEGGGTVPRVDPKVITTVRQRRLRPRRMIVARMVVDWPRSLRFHRRLIMPSRDSEDDEEEVEAAAAPQRGQRGHKAPEKKDNRKTLYSSALAPL